MYSLINANNHPPFTFPSEITAIYDTPSLTRLHTVPTHEHFPYCFTPAVDEGSCSNDLHAGICIGQLLDFHPCSECDIIPHCGFNLHFPISEFEHLFTCLWDIWNGSFDRRTILY